jgi:uncharacterized membrane protein
LTAHNPETIIRDYLEQVDGELADLPAAERREILDDLRSHIDEAVGDTSVASETDVRNVLERLGDPQDVAREARERSPESEKVTPPLPPVQHDRRKTPGALEVAAIVLTALFWPIGVLLAWSSDRWKTRDKVIATAVPFTATFVIALIMFGGVALGGIVAWSDATTDVRMAGDESQPAGVNEMDERSPRQISETTTGEMGAVTRLLVVVGFLSGIIVGPFVTAVFLAVRLQPATSGQYPESGHSERRIPAGGHA